MMNSRESSESLGVCERSDEWMTYLCIFDVFDAKGHDGSLWKTHTFMGKRKHFKLEQRT